MTDNAMPMLENFRNFYKVQKTITFELKTADREGVSFSGTKKYIEETYFKTPAASADGIAELEKMLSFGVDVLEFSEKFREGLLQQSFDWFGFEAHKSLMEQLDRNAYHALKKKREVNVLLKNPKTGRTFYKQYFFQDGMSLDTVIMLTDKTGLQLTDKTGGIADKIRLFKGKIEQDLKSIYSKNTETETVLYYASGKAVFYGFARAYLSHITDLMTLFATLAPSSMEIRHDQETTQRMQRHLCEIKDRYDALLAKEIACLEEVINEEAKKPIILTTLNPRAANKDPLKIESEYEDVLKMEERKEVLESELENLHAKKSQVTQSLETKLKETFPQLFILKEDIQPLVLKKKNNYKSLSDEEKKTLKDHKFAKTVLKYVKKDGVIITNRGRYDTRLQRFVYDDIFNYRLSGEKLSFNPKDPRNSDRRIENHPDFHLLKEEYTAYKTLCEEKRRKAVELGDIKSVYNAVSREVLRQKAMQYLSLIFKDKDYFYLALIDKDENKTKHIVKRVKTSKTSDWFLLKYHKITFKAIEKMALLGSSTFEIEDVALKNTAQKIWKIYKEKSFKNERNRFQREDLAHIIDYVKAVLRTLDEASNYRFQFKASSEYISLDEFALEIDTQGYACAWMPLDVEALFDLEKQGDGKVLIFKLHNKDFGRKTIHDDTRKKNLFTEYWLDAMKLGYETRLTPEIDILKRKKESEYAAKPRERCDKLYGTFRLEFYPDKRATFEEVNNKVRFDDDVYWLGLDRGVNSIVSWCLIDSNGKVQGNGDWTIFEGFSYKEKISEYQKKKLMLLEKYQCVAECDNAIEKSRLLKEARQYENDIETEGLLAMEQVKKGYCSYLLREVNKIIARYPNTYIVLEDLDIKGKVEKYPDINNKIDNLEKTLGGTVYQAVENALVNKFKYYTLKGVNERKGLQLVPDIVRVEDLRVLENRSMEISLPGKVKWVKSKERVGNILFVDEFMTSRICPNCGFVFCGDQRKQSLLPDYAKPMSNDDLEGAPVAWSKDIAGKDILTIQTKDGRVLVVKHLQKVKPEKLVNLKEASTVNSGIKNLLNVRLKDDLFRKKLYAEDLARNDPVICSLCGFDSESADASLPIYSGDATAAYNIARIGVERIESPKGRQVG